MAKHTDRWMCCLALSLLLGWSAAQAQASASHRLEEHTLNAGGHPTQGASPASASHRITLDSIGGGPSRAGIASASNRLDACFSAAYGPPGEVANLRFTSENDLAWDSEASIGSYALYRGLISELAGLGFGDCSQSDLPFPAASDLDPVPAGDGFFFLVTARNRLAEEGSKGNQSSGAVRSNPAMCP